MTYQDTVFQSLSSKGFPGNINDKLTAFFKSNGATGNTLNELGMNFLRSKGFSQPNYNDRWVAYLRANNLPLNFNYPVIENLAQEVKAQLLRLGHSLLIPGVGEVDGFSSGTYSDSAGAVPAVLDDFLGRWVDAGSGGLAFTQATTPNKPLLTKRVNLLTKTEDFTDSIAWSKLNVSPNSNVITGPFQGTYGDSITESSGSSSRFGCYYTLGVPGIGLGSLSREVSIYAKAKPNARYLRLCACGVSSTSFAFITVDLVSGIVTQDAGYVGPVSNVFGDMSDVGGGWYRISLVATMSLHYFLVVLSDSATPAAGVDYGYVPHTGDSSAGVYLFGAQVAHPGSRYQSVNTATNYDTAGFPYRVRFDTNQTLSASIPSGFGYADTTIISALSDGQVTLTGQNLSGVAHTIGPNLDLLGRIYAPNGSSMTAAELALYQRYMNNLAGVA